ncbi:MAG: hypothetical protein P8P83_06015, partial [Rickettsiaceae bacterium]|nr:hypothetical protein [Rickettsiaceae bacterium]
MNKFGEALHEVNPAIERIMVGKGGQTEETLKAASVELIESPSPSYLQNGYNYGDANKQVELYCSPGLREKRKLLSDETEIENQNHIVSSQHADYVYSLDLIFFQKNPKYHVLTSYVALFMLKNDIIAFDDLKDFDVDKIKVLSGLFYDINQIQGHIDEGNIY